jgi:D-ornithine 4,5-aminomutase subunit beta
MEKLHHYAIEKGVRDRLILLAGGTQVTPEIATSNGMDQGFSRGTKGKDVASFIVKKHREIYEN